MSDNEKIRVIIMNDCGAWVAQVLEYDICVQAEDLDDLPARLEVALRLEEDATDGDLSKIGPAPQHFQEQWERRAGTFTPANDSFPAYEMALAA